MSTTSIEWTDVTWNPVTGCSKVSPGCAHCYAETLAKRLHAMGQKGYTGLPWTPENAERNVFLHPDRLDQPLRWRKPRMVFVNSMSDLFHKQVPDEFIAAAFGVMCAARNHTFQILTKRPERMAELVPRLYDAPFRNGGLDAAHEAIARVDRNLTGCGSAFDLLDKDAFPLPNVWLGVSIENRRYVHRADLLRETPAAVRFISAEPLLGPLVPPRHDPGIGIVDNYPAVGLDLTDIDWLIVGGESGPEHRAMKMEWVRDLRDACVCLECGGACEMPEGVGPVDRLNGQPWDVRYRRCGRCHGRGGTTAFFFKQWGGATPKAAGRLLDGRTWDEMPVMAA